MIQRKQSLYLLIVTALMAIFQFSDMAILTQAAMGQIQAESVVFNVWGIKFLNGESIDMLYFGVLSSICTALALVDIFLYKRRALQLSLCYALGVLILGVLIFEGFYAYGFYNSDAYTVDFSLLMLLPLFALPFVYMAAKGIIKDMSILKSYDRIR